MAIAQIDCPASLIDALGGVYPDVLRALDDLLCGVWADHAALEVTPRERGSLAVFASPVAALEAALEAADACGRVAWPAGAEVRVRVGVHTGRLRISSGGFWGEDVRCPASPRRICPRAGSHA